MEKTDLTEYEQRRAASHEVQCRLAASIMGVDRWVCGLRLCRRNKFCVGPMQASPHQQWQIRAQKEIGLSGDAVAALPRCMANRHNDFYVLFQKAMADITEMRRELSDVEVYTTIRRRMDRRRQPEPPSS